MAAVKRFSTIGKLISDFLRFLLALFSQVFLLNISTGLTVLLKATTHPSNLSKEFLADKWLLWVLAEDAEPPPVTRLDFLVSWTAGGKPQAP